MWDTAERLQERLACVSGVCRNRCQRFGPWGVPFPQISGFLAFQRKCQCLRDAWFVSRPWCGTSRVATHGFFFLAICETVDRTCWFLDMSKVVLRCESMAEEDFTKNWITHQFYFCCNQVPQTATFLSDFGFLVWVAVHVSCLRLRFDLALVVMMVAETWVPWRWSTPQD